MYFDPRMQHDLVREQLAEERRRASVRGLSPGSAGGIAIKARLSRFLMRTAFAIDSEESWRNLWTQLSRSDEVARGADG